MSICDELTTLGWSWWLVVFFMVLFLSKELTMGICTCSHSLNSKVRICCMVEVFFLWKVIMGSFTCSQLTPQQGEDLLFGGAYLPL